MDLLTALKIGAAGFKKGNSLSSTQTERTRKLIQYNVGISKAKQNSRGKERKRVSNTVKICPDIYVNINIIAAVKKSE